MTSAILERPGVQALLGRELARRCLGDFCERMDPTYERARHADLLIEHLEAVERGDIKRLAVFMPPRHSKTYHVSERFPAWFMGRNPTRRVILASYGADLAEGSSRKVRNLLLDERWPWPGVRVAQDSAAVNKWATNQGGEVIAAGVGGAMTGFGADLLVIDDPVKGRAEADSETYRESTWDWYTEVARTRLMPGGRIVLCQTRWHEDDLAGRILTRSQDWTVLNMPALAIGDDTLGRAAGEPLWPEWYDAAALAELKSDLTSDQGARGWLALYQQRPTADEGGLFKRAWFASRYAEAPSCELRVLGVDSAFKAGVHNDESALVLVGVTDTAFPVLDVTAGRWEYPELKRRVVEATRLHQPHAIAIEDTASGQSIIQELRASTLLPIVPIKVSASKEARATAVAPLCEAGKVLLPNVSTWGGAFLDQLAAFPTGAHDDMVDAFVHALGYAKLLAAQPREMNSYDVQMGGGRQNEQQAAFQRMRMVAPARAR